MAVSSSQEGAAYVLETGRPVLYMGGFSGSDPVVDVDDLQRLVEEGKLRYILWNGGRGPMENNSGTGSWIQSNCTTVPDVVTGGSILYQCVINN
jgi:4-amino-4-deoxy-L-arabinose transferase-like glycosyltransferase